MHLAWSWLQRNGFDLLCCCRPLLFTIVMANPTETCELWGLACYSLGSKWKSLLLLCWITQGSTFLSTPLHQIRNCPTLSYQDATQFFCSRPLLWVQSGPWLLSDWFFAWAPLRYLMADLSINIWETEITVGTTEVMKWACRNIPEPSNSVSTEKIIINKTKTTRVVWWLWLKKAIFYQ